MQAQVTSDSPTRAGPGTEEKKYQAKAPTTQPFGEEAFEPRTQQSFGGWAWLDF